MIQDFGILPDGRNVSLYTIHGFGAKAMLCSLRATLVRLYAPDKNGEVWTGKTDFVFK